MPTGKTRWSDNWLDLMDDKMELKQDCGVVLLRESLIWHIAHCASRNFLSAIVVSTRSNIIVGQQSINKYIFKLGVLISHSSS